MAGNIVQEALNFDEIEAQVLKKKEELKTPTEPVPAVSMSAAYAELQALDSVSESAKDYNRKVMRSATVNFDEYDFTDMIYDPKEDKALSKGMQNVFSKEKNADFADWFWENEDDEYALPSSPKNTMKNKTSVSKPIEPGMIPVMSAMAEVLANIKVNVESISDDIAGVTEIATEINTDLPKIQQTLRALNNNQKEMRKEIDEIKVMLQKITTVLCPNN